ncbi:CRISPR-associated endoribonuclease Cas6 [Chloroflexota bacterium]|nr:CRISPR-associated endoribonuclease Cas6 [Chloroflexota bacterium]
MPELISVVITLTNPEPVSFPCDQGRALSAAFLSWVRYVDPNFSKQLHDTGSAPKPYTVSNLHTNTKPKTDRVFLQADSQAWFRLTSISADLSKFILNNLLNNLPGEKMTVSKSAFIIKDVTWNPENHPWAGGTSYASLIKDGLLGQSTPQIPLYFASPTAFHSHGVHLPFPRPELAIRSWMKNWNAYSPMKFPESLFEDLQGAIGVSNFKMKSDVIHYGEATFIGGVGNCTYSIVNRDSCWQQMINGLSSFAFYAGTGIKTTIGLGQTRRMDQDDYRAL